MYIYTCTCTSFAATSICTLLLRYRLSAVVREEERSSGCRGQGRGEETGPECTTYSSRGSGEVGENWAQGFGFRGAVRVSVHGN